MHHGSKSHDCCKISNACDGPGIAAADAVRLRRARSTSRSSSSVTLDSTSAFVPPPPPLLHRLALPDAPPPKTLAPGLSVAQRSARAELSSISVAAFRRISCFLSCQFCIRVGAARSTLARPVAAQQTVDVGSISGRVVDESGAADSRRHRPATHQATNIVASAITDTAGPLPAAVSPGSASTTSPSRSPASGFDATAQRVRRLRLRDAGDAGACRHCVQRHRDRGSAGDRSGAQSDCRDRARSGGRGAADERPQLPRYRAARAGRRARATSPARSCFRRRPPFRA